MSAGRPRKITRELFAAAAQRGLTAPEVAAEFQTNRTYVSLLSKKFGIKLRRAVCAQTATDPRVPAISALYRSGMTLKQIGEQFGITRERVRQILRKRTAITAALVWAQKSAERIAQKNAHCLARYGCTYEQWRSLRGKPRAAFIQQRNNAHIRGIEWELTLWQWWTIWQESGHWRERGRGQGYCMCRRGDTGPYAPENVFIAPSRINSSDQARKKSGLPMGVTCKSGRYFMAHACRAGKRHYLGQHPTAELAHAAYLAFVESYEPRRGHLSPPEHSHASADHGRSDAARDDEQRLHQPRPVIEPHRVTS